MKQFISAVPFILTLFSGTCITAHIVGNTISEKHIGCEHHVKTYDAVLPVMYFTFITSLNAPAEPAGVKSSINSQI